MCVHMCVAECVVENPMWYHLLQSLVLSLLQHVVSSCFRRMLKATSYYKKNSRDMCGKTKKCSAVCCSAVI